MAESAFREAGLTELIRACDQIGGRTKKETRNLLREVGQTVRDVAEAKFVEKFGERVDPTAKGFRVVVRQRGVSVEQSLRKTTGRRPDWGSQQMRFGLIPAADVSGPEVARETEKAVEEILGRLDRP